MRYRQKGSSTRNTQQMGYSARYCTANCCTASQVLNWVAQTPITVEDVVLDRQSTFDVVTPKFRSRVEQGEIIMNPYSSRKSVLSPAVLGGPLKYFGPTWQCGSGSAYRYRTEYDIPPEIALESLNSSFILEPSGHLVLNTLLSSGVYEDLVSEASTECLANRGTLDINIWESLAERRQSYRILAELARNANVCSRALDLRKRKGSKRLADFVSSGSATELIYELGITPLLGDLRRLSQAWKKDSTGDVRLTARGLAKNGISKASTFTTTFGTGVNFSNTVFETDEIVARAMSLDEWTVSQFDRFGVGLKGLVTLPWELATLSFVADWFVNVGDFLQAVTPTPAVRQLGSCIVMTRTLSRTVTMGNVTANGVGSIISPCGGTKTGISVETVRTTGLQGARLITYPRSRFFSGMESDQRRIGIALSLFGQKFAKVLRTL